MHWIEERHVAEHCPEYARAGETYQGKGPDLLTRTTKYLMETNKAQNKEWYGKIKTKMKQSNVQAQKNAQVAGLRHEDPKVKAARLSKENAANGKLRDKIAVPADIDEATAKQTALDSEKVRPYTDGRTVDKVVFVAGRHLVSVVVKG